MIWELVGTIMVAVAIGGAAHMLVRVSGGRLPGWLVPASAGLGMLIFVIYMEYSWSGRLIDQLPEEATVASRNATTAWFRPWTFVVPLTNRMTIVDHRFDRTHADHPGLVITRLVLLGRWDPARPVPVVFDCTAARRADLRDDVRFGADGALEGVRWLALSPDDPVLRTVCDGRAAVSG
ncbi:MAG: hypothetical protein ACXIU8_14850 [Alkalilacustris sp.]